MAQARHGRLPLLFATSTHYCCRNRNHSLGTKRAARPYLLSGDDHTLGRWRRWADVETAACRSAELPFLTVSSNPGAIQEGSLEVDLKFQSPSGAEVLLTGCGGGGGV